MIPDESMDGLLRRNRFREAVMRMECALLEEREVQEELLRQIPDSYLNASPLLLQALGIYAMATVSFPRRDSGSNRR